MIGFGNDKSVCDHTSCMTQVVVIPVVIHGNGHTCCRIAKRIHTVCVTPRFVHTYCMTRGNGRISCMTQDVFTLTV